MAGGRREPAASRGEHEPQAGTGSERARDALITHWQGRKVLVSGGASFIGSHLVDALVSRGAQVRVADNLSSGRIEHLGCHLASGRVELIQGDLLDLAQARRAVQGISVAFHLAANHGGRGYVDLHQAACASNLALDGMFFLACCEAGVEKVVYASSGCVYPSFRQTDPQEELYLSEDMVGPPYDADNTYGWAKLMGEMTLRDYCRERGLQGVSCRYFTVYGERGKEDHAIMAMIARAFVKQDPFEVWGTGEQVRNWTYVGDIVEGTLLAAERVGDGTAINLGTSERTRVIEAVQEILRYSGHSARIQFRPDMPTGPLNRVADGSLARRLLGWEPKVRLVDGLHRTINWYFATKDRDELRTQLAARLTER
jgi:nucleoside-diphosphate-sugar epimerase